MSKDTRVYELIENWKIYRQNIAEPKRYLELSRDLYNVRNSLGSYPSFLIDSDDEVMAAVEHYFLCRGWVGNGIYPKWQVEQMGNLYNLGKLTGLTPRHNPNKPTTPVSVMQMQFQYRGMQAGEADAKKYNIDTPTLPKQPPKYY